MDLTIKTEDNDATAYATTLSIRSRSPDERSRDAAPKEREIPSASKGAVREYKRNLKKVELGLMAEADMPLLRFTTKTEKLHTHAVRSKKKKQSSPFAPAEIEPNAAASVYAGTVGVQGGALVKGEEIQKGSLLESQLLSLKGELSAARQEMALMKERMASAEIRYKMSLERE